MEDLLIELKDLAEKIDDLIDDAIFFVNDDMDELKKNHPIASAELNMLQSQSGRFLLEMRKITK